MMILIPFWTEYNPNTQNCGGIQLMKLKSFIIDSQRSAEEIYCQKVYLISNWIGGKII